MFIEHVYRRSYVDLYNPVHWPRPEANYGSIADVITLTRGEWWVNKEKKEKKERKKERKRESKHKRCSRTTGEEEELQGRIQDFQLGGRKRL